MFASAILWCCVLGSLIPAVVALKCYSCMWRAGVGHRECMQEPPPAKFLKRCIYPQCWKLITGYENGTVTAAQRFCVAVARGQSFCQADNVVDEVTGASMKKVECVCSTQGCNGAGGATSISNDFENKSMSVSAIFWIIFGWPLLLA